MNYHFFVTNMAEWQASTNLVDLVKYFDKFKQRYCVCLVPLDITASYKIKDYLPEVEDRVVLGTYKNGERVED